MFAPTVAPDASRGRAWHDPSIDPRTLYIGMKVLAYIDCDADALKVRVENHNTARVPFGRVGRIVCGSRAVWTQPALVACVKHGIAVVMAGARSAAAGVLIGTQPRTSALDTDLTLLAERPDAIPAWNVGMRSVRSRLFRAAWVEAGLSLDDPRWTGAQRDFVCDRRPPPDDHASRPTARAYAATAARLSQAGVQLRYATQGRRWLELAHDIAVSLDDWNALRQPLLARHADQGRLADEAFEAGHLSRQRTDVVMWCVLILRRALQAHTVAWP